MELIAELSVFPFSFLPYKGVDDYNERAFLSRGMRVPLLLLLFIPLPPSLTLSLFIISLTHLTHCFSSSLGGREKGVTHFTEHSPLFELHDEELGMFGYFGVLCHFVNILLIF